MSKRKQPNTIMSTPRSTRSTEKGAAIADPDSAHSSETDDTDPDTPMTYSLFKELIREMRDDINNNTDRKMQTITQDISEIKTGLETHGERFDEMENRVSDAEDRLDKIEEVGGEIDILREQWEKAIKQANKEACLARKNNMIINGMPGSSKETKDVKTTLKKLCVETLKLGEEWFNNADIKEVYNFPAKKKTDPWPIFVRFGNSSYKDDMFRAAHNLKGTNITLRHDLAPCLIEERNDLNKTATRLRKDPYNLLTRIRETSFEVRLLVRKTVEEDWKEWHEND